MNKSNHRLPEYATPGSAGMDLKANTTEPIVLKPLERQMIPTGIHIQPSRRVVRHKLTKKWTCC